jgi:acyl CoA:acetate/3-ketoacid CoA transferase
MGDILYVCTLYSKYIVVIYGLLYGFDGIGIGKRGGSGMSRLIKAGLVGEVVGKLVSWNPGSFGLVTKSEVSDFCISRGKVRSFEVTACLVTGTVMSKFSRVFA